MRSLVRSVVRSQVQFFSARWVTACAASSANILKPVSQVMCGYYRENLHTHSFWDQMIKKIHVTRWLNMQYVLLFCELRGIFRALKERGKIRSMSLIVQRGGHLIAPHFFSLLQYNTLAYFARFHDLIR